MSSSSSSSSAASASAVFPPSPQSQTPPPLLVVENNLPPLNQLAPPPASEQLCYVHCHFCDTVLVVSVPTSSLFKTVTVRCGHCNGLLTVNMRGLLIPGTPTTSTAAAAATPATSVVTTSTTATTLITTPPPVVSSANNNNGQFLRFPNSVSLVPNPLHHHSILEEISSVNPTSLQLLEQNRLMTPGARTAAAPAPPPQLRAGKGATEPSPRTNNNGAVLNRPPEKRQRVPSAYNRFIKDEIQRIKAGNPDISHREAFSAAAKNWAHFPHIHFGLMPDPHGLMKTNPLTQDRKDSGLLKEGLYAAAAAAAAANMGVAPY